MTDVSSRTDETTTITVEFITEDFPLPQASTNRNLGFISLDWRAYIPEFKFALILIKHQLQVHRKDQELEDLESISGVSFIWILQVAVYLLARSKRLILFANTLKPGDRQYQVTAESIQKLFDASAYNINNFPFVVCEIILADNTTGILQIAAECRLFGGKIMAENRLVITELVQTLFS